MIFACNFDWPDLVGTTELPPDWSSVWYDVPLRIRTTPASPLGGHVLYTDGFATYDGSLAAWAQPDLSPSTADVDILVLASCTGTSPFTTGDPIVIAYRGVDPAADQDNNCYTFKLDSSSATNVYRKVDGVETKVCGFSRTNLGDTWYWMRVRASGDQHMIKVWEYGEGEPQYWQATGTDATFTEGGYIGVGSEGWQSNDVEANFAYISVGTEGNEPRKPSATVLPPNLNTIQAFKSKLSTDGSSLLVFLGYPNRTVQWTLATGDGILTAISSVTDDQGRAYAKYDPGTLGAKTIEVTYGT